MIGTKVPFAMVNATHKAERAGAVATIFLLSYFLEQDVQTWLFLQMISGLDRAIPTDTPTF